MQILSKKIVLIGNIHVGKTSLIKRFVHHKFSEEYISTIGVGIEKKVVEIENEQVTLLIWDLEGESSVEDLSSSYLIGSQGIIYVFDLSRKITWKNLAAQIEYLNENFPFIPIQIVGNKSDLVDERQIKLIRSLLDPVEFYASSAKTGENVENVFNDLAKTFLF